MKKKREIGEIGGGGLRELHTLRTKLIFGQEISWAVLYCPYGEGRTDIIGLRSGGMWTGL
jgi:hypothetical protein